MGIRKRDVWIVSLLVFVLLLSFNVYAGYCGNPAESLVCQEVDDVEDCCPSDGDYYDSSDDTVPDSQSDCEANWYSETDDTVGGLCDIGCCYESTEETCDSSVSFAECEYYYGTFDTSCDDISECTEGCCIYDDGNYEDSGEYASDIFSYGHCTEELDYVDYDETITSSSECSIWGGEYATAETECNDGIDNDGDGAEDYPNDPGCKSAADSSETDNSLVCDDGIDNDGDGDVDLNDEGCCADSETSNEQLCELAQCDPDDELTTVCNCYDEAEGINEEAGTYCAAGNYCIDGICESEAGGECSSGERDYCGTDSDGCLMYQTCSDGKWSDCEASASCGSEPELCSDGIDNDGDELIDCLDIDCYETKCGDSSDASACSDYGFDPDDTGSTYVCCSSTDINDCDEDGTYDTCGSCDCLTTGVDPDIDDVTFTLGSKQLTVEWSLACAVDFRLRRCSGDGCVDDTTDMTTAEIEAVFSVVTGSETISGAWQYTDTTIEANQRYCYVVEALYEPTTDNTFSQPYCIEDSGDELCQTLSTSEFCLDNYGSIDNTLVYRAGCTEENKVSYIESCRAEYGSDYICIGPYNDGTTSCEYQSDCESCGDPLGLYALLDYSVLLNDGDDYYGELCYQLPMCYFDYTETTINNFHECADISSCYDYASQTACEQQANDEGFTNKCLQRNCAWEDLGSSGGIQFGICKELSTDYALCDACNDAEHNGIFDACTQDRCAEFGVDEASCYLSGLTGLCTDITDFTCTAYEDSTSCRGDHNVDIDPETNEVTQASEDALSIGLCYWDGDQCYKDANGDGDMDDGQEDMTPPTTTVLSSDKMQAIEISLLATDYNEDGSLGDGVKTTYYCVTQTEGGCSISDGDYDIVELDETGTGYIEEGDGSGTYYLYYYSEDYAENLEVVNEWEFEIDKAGPDITISYYVTPDTSDPYDESALTFEVILDEESYCTDSFETGESEIENEYNDHFVVKYEDLSDGWYLYSIECTDALGNSGDAFVFANIDADTAIFDASPQQYVDDADVTLSVKTFDNVECGFSYDKEENDFENMDYGFSSSDEGDYYLHSEEWTLEDGNGLYFFDVKCELSDGTISDDEIQFVYDDTAPNTDVVDSFGDVFDYAAFYQGDDVDVYLACNDEPEYGFGCKATYYCIDETTCSPDTLYYTTDSIEYDGESTDAYVCYYSSENTYAGIGGLTESTQCTELSLDYYNPSIEITSPADREIVYVDQVTVKGEVDDPDASSSTAVNTVKITLLTTEGDEITFDDIDASDGTFSYLVDGLTLETNTTTYNYITVYATDRSGATTDTETVGVLYTTEVEGDAIWIEEPSNGVSDETEFDFVIGTFLEAEICGYSKSAGIDFEHYIALEPVAGDSADEYLYGSSYSISEAKDGIPEYVYVTCELVNGVQYSEKFNLEYDSTEPEIEDIYIVNSDGKEPPTVVEEPLDPNVFVETDDRTLCKYSLDESDGFSTGMTKFDNYDEGNYNTTNNVTIEGLDDQTSYTVYVACQNGAYMTSDTESLDFTIDSTAASGMYLIYPEVIGSTTFDITIGTTRTASYCYYSDDENDISTTMTKADSKEWITNSITVESERVYTYYFSCGFADGEAVDYFDIIVDTSAPEIDWIEDGNVSYSNTTLSAAWSASDDLTKITGYEYSIGSRPDYNDIFNWTGTNDDEAIVEDLELVNQSTYYWNVKAVNEVDLWSDADSSDGVFIDASGNGASWDLDENTISEVDYHTCSNNELDEDETDVDCGGSCDACEAGYACEADKDCSSSNCLGGICQESTCDDYIQNQGESDVDCGGNYCDACLEGYSCVYHRDCNSGYCEGKVCTASSCYDGVENGDETGVDCGGSCDACEDVEYQSSPPKTQDDVDNKGLGWLGWLAILLLLIAAGIGGYYGYAYYMKKKGKPLPPLTLSGLTNKITNKKSYPSFRKKKVNPLQVKQQMAPARQRLQQYKHETRQKLFSTFEEKKKPTEKLPVKRPIAVKPANKIELKKETVKNPTSTKKLGETVVVKKTDKKGKSKAFTELEKLIKEKKRR